jgi:DNA-binding NarL/FixJ family response regulator
MTSTRNYRGPRSTVTEPDLVAVDRALAGDHRIILAKVERDAAIDRLDSYGLTAREVAERLATAERTVTRRRRARREHEGEQ